jgi:carboxymethylenebutenolidase
MAAAPLTPTSSWPGLPDRGQLRRQGPLPTGYRAAAPLERALAANGVERDIKVYLDAGHGFLNDDPPADRTPLMVVLNLVSGTRYHEPSAQDACRRLVAFFDTHLKSAPNPA